MVGVPCYHLHVVGSMPASPEVEHDDGSQGQRISGHVRRRSTTYMPEQNQYQT